MRITMRTPALVTFVAFVISSSSSLKPVVDIVKVISDESLSDSQRSQKLKAEKSQDTVIGAPFSLSCTLGDEAEIELCSWRLQDGPQLYVKGSDVLDARRNKIEGISVNQTNPRSCHISIDSLSSWDLGTWSCRVHHSASEKYQEAHIEVSENIRDINVRLPTNVKPSRYQLYLIPFIVPDNFTISGHVEIQLDVSEPTDNITLHIYDITIHERDVTVLKEDGSMVEIVGHGYDEERQFYIIQLAEAVSSQLSVSIFFTGVLNDELAGFYRSSYTEDGQKKYIATTQFEATDARRAFPCFDEPAMKAVFQINLGRLPTMSSISNMPIIEEGVAIQGSEYVWDIYQDSLKMSTYLVAFVVSDFVYRKSEPMENGVEFRIWSREGAVNQTEWASVIGPQILHYYEDYFNTSFPLPKQDMIAIPDFSAGAMENWGLITYRESALLYEPGKSSLSDQEYVAIVVAHELAHQWFGDLVTMEWWTDLWLNEGFASYTEYIGTNFVSPQTFILDRFILESLQPALGYDSLESSHPISIPVNVPNEINEIFDTISYLKGGSVIRMMANYLGVNTFNKGITNYLHANAYGNANQDTLWQFLTDAAVEDGTLINISVKEIMDTWTVQMGYPVIDFQRDYESSSANLQQNRFLLTTPTNTSDEHDYTWWVPISWTTTSRGFDKTSPDVWMNPKDAMKSLDIVLDNVSADEPVIVNVQQTGFYRVNYDVQNWDMISSTLLDDHTKIHRINRAQVMDDAFDLARGGLLDYSTALRTTEYLKSEVDYIPWKAALTGFVYLENMMKRTAGFGDLKTYLIGALQPLYERLGFEEQPDDTFLDEKLRIVMFGLLCRLDHKECNDFSLYLLNEWMSLPDPDTSSPIPTSLQTTVLCSGIAKGDVSHWDFLWERYGNSNNANEKVNIMTALSCSNEIWILERYLEMALNEESGVRKQDGYRVIVGVSRNTAGRYLAWNWIRQFWPELSAYYDTAISSSVGRIITAVASDFNTEFELQELQTFITDHEDELGSASRDAKQMVEGTKSNIDWMQKHYQTIVDWLQENLPAQPSP
eukprot:GFUD01029145.1.p1 GENE.GFUD01029145.1~~GFUD01029145.1.p1  ORF type:complete len:1053 (+),score=224.11 GFUD01029145.1:199-3357(+)